LGAISAAADIGRQCPEDISVVGFGDAPASGYWRPNLTTFSMSCDDIAARTIERLVETILIPVEFIIRNSTARRGEITRVVSGRKAAASNRRPRK
jgi:DNA-binding LacI/PurR family transcriptional regulator